MKQAATNKVWLELRYGIPGHGVTLCRLDTPYALQVFKRCALVQAKQLAEESKGIDDIIHFLDEIELEKVQTLLGKLIPGEEREDEN